MAFGAGMPITQLPSILQGYGRTASRLGTPSRYPEYKQPFKPGVFTKLEHPVVEDILNIVDVPAKNLAAGLAVTAGVSSVMSRQSLKRFTTYSDDIARALNNIKNFDDLSPNAQIGVIDDVTKTIKKVIPQMGKSKEMRVLSNSKPRQWLDLVGKYLNEGFQESRRPGSGLKGFSTKALGDVKKADNLATEARKYKSAEEWINEYVTKTNDNYLATAQELMDKHGIDITFGGTKQGTTKVEWRENVLYPKLKAFYNQAKGVGGDLASEARKYKSAEELIKEWDDGFWKINKQAKIVGVPINEIGNKITTRQKSVTEKGVLEWIDKIKNGERPTILVGIRENLTKGKIGKRPLEPTVLDGYHRLEAYRRLGFKEVPVLDNTPKSQLTSIYNQAKGVGVKPKKKIVTVPREQVPVGVGKKKVSRLEARVKQTLDNVSQEQIDKLGLATYNQMNKKDNIRLASEYVLNNPQEALEVLKGNKSAPKGILRNSIYVAMENMAKGDVELARKLATLEATRFGQELSILTELDKDSPVKAMQDIIQVRRRAIERKTGKKVDQLVKNETAKIKKEVSNKYNWGAFLKEIRC